MDKVPDPLRPGVLATERLLIRPYEAADLAAVAALLDACFGVVPIERRAAWLDWSTRNYDALYNLNQPPYGDRAVVRRSDGALVGSVGLVPSLGPFEGLPSFRRRLAAPAAPRFTPEVGLFWAVAPASRGAGIATEAARALIDFAFRGLGLDRLVATTEHDNTASIAVMRRLGMTVETNPDSEPAWFQVVGILTNPGEQVRQAQAEARGSGSGGAGTV